MAKRQRKAWVFKDFRVVLDLPERLAQYLRLFLHVDLATWNFAMDKIRQGKPYTEWSKSKGRGKGKRYFAAPCDELKVLQKAVSNRFFSQIPVHFARHGNQKGSSIMTNVGTHAGFAKSIFSVDIVNAFPSVYRSRIQANLEKPFEFAMRQFKGLDFSDDDKAKMLESIVDIVCWHDRLPQGPPTSPQILDIVCMKLDQEVFELLQSNGTPLQSYRYTAWCDDLTISSDGEIPEEIRNGILKIIKENGFFPHTREDKTKYFSPETGEVPVVTGLVINPDGRITMAPNKVNQLRAGLKRLLNTPEWSAKDRQKIGGYVGFIRQVYPQKLPSKLAKAMAEIETRLGRSTERLPKFISAEVQPEAVPETAPAAVKPLKKKKASKKTAKELIAA